VPFYDLYLSFTGGPALRRLARLGARAVRPLYCAVDPAQHAPVDEEARWDLGYLGTYAPDRQPSLEALLLRVAQRWRDGRFVVAGPLYPGSVQWPANVVRVDHVAPGDHSRFYGGQRFTLNLTRADMRRLGYSPSVRLFEAAACGAAILTDDWDGLEEFFEPDREILRVRTARDVERALHDTTEADRQALGRAAHARVLAAHTADHRAETLEEYASELLGITVPPGRSDRVASIAGRRRDTSARLGTRRSALTTGEKKDLTA
jgi:spore maturation protein CgeB